MRGGRTRGKAYGASWAFEDTDLAVSFFEDGVNVSHEFELDIVWLVGVVEIDLFECLAHFVFVCCFGLEHGELFALWSEKFVIWRGDVIKCLFSDRWDFEVGNLMGPIVTVWVVQTSVDETGKSAVSLQSGWTATRSREHNNKRGSGASTK